MYLQSFQTLDNWKNKDVNSREHQEASSSFVFALQHDLVIWLFASYAISFALKHGFH